MQCFWVENLEGKKKVFIFAIEFYHKIYQSDINSTNYSNLITLPIIKTNYSHDQPTTREAWYRRR